MTPPPVALNVMPDDAVMIPAPLTLRPDAPVTPSAPEPVVLRVPSLAKFGVSTFRTPLLLADAVAATLTCPPLPLALRVPGPDMVNVPFTFNRPEVALNVVPVVLVKVPAPETVSPPELLAT